MKLHRIRKNHRSEPEITLLSSWSVKLRRLLEGDIVCTHLIPSPRRLSSSVFGTYRVTTHVNKRCQLPTKAQARNPEIGFRAYHNQHLYNTLQAAHFTSIRKTPDPIQYRLFLPHDVPHNMTSGSLPTSQHLRL
ncbi:hypothetical protein WAI453_010351 [Rhynchosporium graminicola]